MTDRKDVVGPVPNSAEGAAFNSHDRKAVDQDVGLRSRPVGPTLLAVKRVHAAPSALDNFLIWTIHGLTAAATK